MIYSLKGKLVDMVSNFAVIECAGVGYRCFISNNTASKLPPLNEETTLFTHMNVKDDAIELYGFGGRDELSCFRMLIGISGVGAKVALAILSTHSANQVAMAIAGGDVNLLTMSPGVGKKTAQRIILELKDKINKIAGEQALGVGSENVAEGQPNAASNVAKAINALMVLGYSSSEVVPIITKFDSGNKTEELIRLTLKELGGGK